MKWCQICTHDIGSPARNNIKKCSCHIIKWRKLEGHQPGAQMVREMLGLTGSMAQKPMGLPIKGSKQTMLLGHRPWQSPKHPNNQTPVAQSRKHEVRCHRMSLVRGSMVPLKCSCVRDLTPQGFAGLPTFAKVWR